MMVRKLLIAAALLAVLGGGVWYSNKLEQEKEGKPAADAPPRILEIPEDQVAQVEVRKPGGAPPLIVKRAAGGNWEITSPEALRADQDAVKGVAGAFTSLASDKVIEEKTSNLAPFGLATPSAEVIVTKKDGKTEKLLIGDETPTGSSFYVMKAGDPRVFTFATFTKNAIDKTANDLRDKRLLTFDSDKLTRVELLAKGQTIEFGKNNKNEWAILKPRPLRADNLQAEELVRKLKDAKMDTAVSAEDAAKAASTFASSAPVATAKVTDNSGTQQIEVRKSKDNNYYAKSSVVDGVHKVANDLGEGLAKSLDDFRNKKLFDFGFNDPSKVEIKAGDKTYSFVKAGDKWSAGGKPADPVGVQSVIDKLRDLQSIKFLEAATGAPALEATVTSQDGKQLEKVTILKNGNVYAARRENEPAAYELDGKIVEEITKAAADVKEPPPPPPAAKK